MVVLLISVLCSATEANTFLEFKLTLAHWLHWSDSPILHSPSFAGISAYHYRTVLSLESRTRRLAGLVIFGSLVMTALGSAIFANTILFRAILMTDWLFLFYFLAAVWFPIEALTRRTIGGLDTVMASRSGELDECTQFQNTLSLSSRRPASWLVVAIVVGFFALSGVRLIALTIANPPKRGTAVNQIGSERCIVAPITAAALGRVGKR